MFLDDRKKRILQTIVDYYINSAEPIASKMIANDYGLELSSATIRNEMAEMEEMGLLEKTHTSSGRIPSDLGYRYYVDDIMDTNNVSDEEISEFLDYLSKGDKDPLQKATMALSGVTHYTSISKDEDGIFLYGRNNIFDYPEFNDIENLRKFMYMLEEEELLKGLFDEPYDSEITVKIGKENSIEEFKDYGVIVFPYKDKGDIAIIGPKRMDYSKVVSYAKKLLKE